jgi:hypothetical protein
MKLGWLVVGTLLTLTAAMACQREGSARNTGSGGSGGMAAGSGGAPSQSGGTLGTGGTDSGAGGQSGSPVDATVVDADAGVDTHAGTDAAADTETDAAADAPSDLGRADSGSDALTSTPGPAFAAVLTVFKARCVSCHAAGAIAPGMPQLHLTADVAYRSLVGAPAEQACGGTLVVPSDSERSYLLRKLVDTIPCKGMQMPLAYEAPFMALKEADLAAIRVWIDQGALP